MSDSTIRAREASVFLAQGKRPAQEDHAVTSSEKGIWVIADGFGGPRGGQVAAQTACEAVRTFLVKEAGDLEATLPFVLRTYFSLGGNVLFNALIHANKKVTQLNREKDVHERGGASVIAGFVDGDLLALGTVGGCTAWLFRDNRSVELVMPRTYARMCDPFEKNTSDEAANFPLASLGTSNDLEPEIFEVRLRPGDWILLQSDGLPAEVRNKVFDLLTKNSKVGLGAARQLLEQAHYSDNVVVALISF